MAKPKENSLELVVNLVNLNYTKGKEILERSPSLLGYSKLLFYIREEMKANGGDLQGAINLAVKHCMEEGLIADFLQKHSREVTGMLFKEITVEEFAEIRAREAAKDAYDEGEKSGFSKGEKLGAAQKEREIVKQMLKEGMTKVTIRKKTRQQKQAKRKALKNHSPETEIDQDDTFFFIAGYTAGGVPYGVTWEEMGLKPWQKYEEEECEDAFL